MVALFIVISIKVEVAFRRYLIIVMLGSYISNFYVIRSVGKSKSGDKRKDRGYMFDFCCTAFSCLTLMTGRSIETHVNYFLLLVS